MECILEKQGEYYTYIHIDKPKQYLKDACIKISSLGGSFSRISSKYEEIAKCLPQISSENKCDALLGWTQSIYFKYEHLDQHYFPGGDMMDYSGEMSIVLDRCKKLESYMKELGGSTLLPPECGKTREVANIIYNHKSKYSGLTIQDQFDSLNAADNQPQYFIFLEDNFACSRPHSMCGEQMSDAPYGFY